MAKNYIKIEGDKEFKKILSELPKQLHNNAMRAIARKGGRVVVKEARSQVQVHGHLGRLIKKDIGVVSDRSNKSGVKVKLTNKYFTDKDGKQITVRKIAGHFTEGVKQGNRKGRGKVKQRFSDFIKKAGADKKNEVIAVMNKEGVVVIQKTIAKWRRKSR